jgi:8-hydroxy-5-deazaflavin:NADPH oxidoreductase
MRIAILGAGSVGGGLGAALTSVGHSVVFGVRDPGSANCRAALVGARGSSAATPAIAVADADVIVFALRWDAVPDTVAALPSLEGRVVIDAMNRFGGGAARSTSEDLAALLHGARIVKAFNTIGFENFTTARARAVPAAMFVAGDDPDAKRVASGLAAELGFRPEDAGPLINARALEQMAKVWVALAGQYGRTIGFAISDG